MLRWVWFLESLRRTSSGLPKPIGLAVMPVLPQKLRSGLVELRTDRGLVYVDPSFWERLYLLWTFRNFHRLPQQVLNRRQQQLIEKLCRTAVVARKNPVTRAELIGAVENLKAVIEQPVQGRKLVTMPPARTFAKAAGFGTFSINRNRPVDGQTRITRFPGSARDNVQFQNLRQGLSRLFPLHLNRFLGSIRENWAIKNWAAGGVVLGAVVLLTVLSRFRMDHIWIPDPAPHATNALTSPPASLFSQLADSSKVRGSGSVPLAKAADIVAPPLAERHPPARNNEPPSPKNAVPPRPAPAVQAESVQRPYRADSPETGFRYPTAPAANLRGQVMLRAIIGLDGHVTSVDVLNGNPLLARAAAGAIGHWRYAPHKINGVAVETETKIVINFLGEDAVSIAFPPAE